MHIMVNYQPLILANVISGVLIHNCNDTGIGTLCRRDNGHGVGDEDVDDLLDYHPTIPASLRIVLLVLLPVLCSIGIIGNSLVLWIFCRSKALRIPQNLMIINLAVSDLLMVVTLFPMIIISVVHGKWYLTDAGCTFEGFCGALFGISSISTLTVIAINRCYSLERLRCISHRRSFTMLVITWLYSLFWATLPFFGIGDYVMEGYAVNCTFQYLNQSMGNKMYVGFLFCGAFAVPVTVITTCYAKIYTKIRSHNSILREFEGNDADSDRDRVEGCRLHKLEFQIAKIGVILTLLFIISWTPYATVALIGQYISPRFIASHPMLQLIPVLFAKCSPIWNSFVYAIKHSNFRAALRAQIMLRFHSKNNTNSSISLRKLMPRTARHTK